MSHQRTISTVALIALVLSALLLASCASEASDEQCWNNSLSGTCPRGMVNDPAPGNCRNYVDLNNDSFCDRSQPATIPG